MSNTGQRYLNGSQFTNITVIGDCVDDGSIEASGTLFVNTIKEYNTTDPGVNIEDCYFQAGTAIITSNQNSINQTTASLIVNGGASILKDTNIYGILNLFNTTNSNTVSDGSLVINGGLGLRHNLNIGGSITIFNTTPSYNKTSGSFITLGGISIQNTTDSTSFTSGGGLSISGGASIEKTLFANIINTNNATILNGNVYTLNNTIGNIISIISSNISTNNISSNSLYTNYLDNNFSNISNLNLTYGTFGNINASSINTLNQIITHSTIDNLITNFANINTIISTLGYIESLTLGNLHVTNNIEYNNIVTNLSTANIISNFATIASLLLTNGTFSNLYGNNLQVTNITNTNLLNTNLSSANAYIINQTILNSIVNNQTIGSLNVTNIYNQFSTIANLLGTNFTCNNISSSVITSNSLILSGTTPSFNSSTGILISYGGISINITENSTSYTHGGSITIAGGSSIAKDLYVGNTIFTTNISSENFITNTSTIASLIGNNISFNNSLFNNLLLSGTNSSLNSSTGTLVSYGGISIKSTENATSITQGGGFTNAGGASIAKNLLVGETISSSVISSNILTALYSTLYNISNTNLTNTNLLNTNFTNTNLLTTNLTNTNFINTHSTITNLNSQNNTTNNLYASNIYTTSLTTDNALLSNISYGTLIGNYINANIITNNTFTSLSSTIANLVNSNTTITSLQLTNGTFGGLSGSYININNATISSLISTNISTTNETATNLLATNISTANIIGTNANFIYATIGHLSTPSLLISNATISNLYVTNLTSDNLNVSYETIGNSLINNIINTNISSNNSNLTNIYNTNFTSNNSLINNLINTNFNSINSTITSLNVTNSSISNIISNNSSISNLTSLFINTSNLYTNNFTTQNIYANYGTFTDISSSNLLLNNASIANLISYNNTISNILSSNITSNNFLSTNISSSSINVSGLTANNINFTGTLYQNGLPYISSQWTSINSYTIVYYNSNGNSFVGINTTSPNNSLDVIGNVFISGNTSFGSNITAQNLTINANITAQNITISNINTSTLTTSTISANNILSLNSSISNLNVMNSIMYNSNLNNITSNNLISNNLISNNFTSNFNTLGTIITTNTTPNIFLGPLLINDTQNATGYTNGGSLTLKGGLTIFKDVYINGYTSLNNNLNLNNNVISNVTSPNTFLDVANKYYVDNRFDNFTTGNVNGNFTQGQIIIASTNGNITGYSSFIYNHTLNLLSLYGTEDSTSLTNGGTLQVYGGVSINKQLFVGGNTHILGYLDMNNQKITSLAMPTTFYDAVNKYYVDDRFDNFTTGNVNGNFTQGQVIIAGTSGNITSFDTFTFDSGLLSLTNTNNSTNLTTPGTFITYGGANILKTLFVGQGIDANSQIISNVTSPNNLLDVANKYYVDNRFNQFTIGNVSGNFTQGQVIIAGTNGNIIGYPSFTFNTNGLLTLSNTDDSTNLTTPGTFITYGGANILKTLFVGQGIDANNQIISNVTSPSNLLDVANKYYVDNRFNQFTIGNVSGNFTQGQVIIAGTNGNITGYPSFTFNTSGLSILTTDNAINLTNGGSLTVLGGASFNKNVYIGNGLDVNNNLITSVALPINPKDAVNKEYVDYYLGINSGDIRETNFILANNVIIPTDIIGFLFLNTKVSSFEAIVYLQIPELNIYDQWNIHGVLKSNKWVVNSTFIGDYPNKVSFSITDSGQVQYTNLNISGTATIRFKASTTSQGLYTNITLGNIIRAVPDGGTGIDFFTQGSLLIGDGVNFIKTSVDLMYLNNTLFLNNTSNASNLTTASVIFSGGASIQKNLLVGNGIDLNMQKITNLAIPTNPYDAANKYYVDDTFSSGGSLNLNGQVSFYNTLDATSITNGGSLTISGGTSIAKQLYVGGISYYINSSISSSTTTGSVIISGGLGVNGNIHGTNSYFNNLLSSNISTSNLLSSNISTSNLLVNSTNMSPSLGDIFKEISFNASNNVNIPDSITGFVFSSNVRYFTAWLSVFITAIPNLVTAFTVEGLQLNSGVWEINYRFIGNNTKIKLHITNSGQIQYTCPGIPGFISSLMKFRAITTSV